MVHHFDHRFATYERDGTIRDTTLEEHQDPTFAPMPRYWVEEGEVEERLVKRDRDGNEVRRWEQPWLLGFRDIARSTDERTAIFSLIPRVAVGNNLPLALPAGGSTDGALMLLAATTSLVFDFAARQAVGGSHMNFFIVEQLPIPGPMDVPADEAPWVVRNTARLATTDVTTLATIPASGTPTWIEPDRHRLRASLDAYFFELFGLGMDDVAHVLDNFPTLARREVQAFGEYRTKRLVLESLAERPWQGGEARA